MLIEYFTQWLEDRYIISSTRQEKIQPDFIDPSKVNTIKTVTRKVIIPEKYKDDIQKLFEFKVRDAQLSLYHTQFARNTNTDAPCEKKAAIL